MKLSHTTTIAARCAVLLAAASIQVNAVAAQGGGTWRCGNTYTDRPCEGGSPIKVSDVRDASQKRDADESTRDAHAAAGRMEGDRRRLEAAGARNRPTLIDNAPRQDVNPQAGAGKDPAAKLRKGKKEVLYASMQAGSDSAPKKKSKKKKSGD